MNAKTRKKELIASTLEAIEQARENLNKYEELLKDETRSELLESFDVGLIVLNSSIDEDEDSCLQGLIHGSSFFVKRALSKVVSELNEDE